ncbi:MAG: hypothetical protein R3C28_02460 [Pirellulaceae bacterium]
MRLEYQVNISRDLLNVESDDSRRHVRLLQEVFRDGQSRLVAPMSGGGEPDSPGNPTNTLLVLSPMKSDEGVEGLIEVFQRPDAQPASHQGYLRFLDQMRAKMVGDWMKSKTENVFRPPIFLGQRLISLPKKSTKAWTFRKRATPSPTKVGG